MSTPITKELIRLLPKTDLHLHLDGSIRIPTLIELARESKVDLPSWTEEGLIETVFKKRYSNLKEYLRGFKHTCEVMQTPEQLERIAYELAVDCQNEGVRYIETRFAPQLHAHEGFDTIEVLKAVNRGLSRAKREYNQSDAVTNANEPPFSYGIIACAMRQFGEQFSSYHRAFWQLHSYSSPERVHGLASLELAQAAAIARREEGLPVVGIDLAGSEEGNPPHHHREAYDFAHRHFLKKTVHAGEAYGPESIFQAITELHADRIGHGTCLFNPQAIRKENIANPERYIRDLAQFIADRRITIEVCLTSNMQTNPLFKRLEDHPFGLMMDHRLSVTLCTDNRTISHTTVTDEIYKAATHFKLSIKDIKSILAYGFKRSFFPDDYAAKRAYVRTCLDYFERVEKNWLEAQTSD